MNEAQKKYLLGIGLMLGGIILLFTSSLMSYDHTRELVLTIALAAFFSGGLGIFTIFMAKWEKGEK